MQASILMVSNDHALSRSRSLLLQQWRTVAVDPDVALDVIAGSAWDLLIICQTVPEDIASRLALKMNSYHPSAKVMAINREGKSRSFPSAQFTLKMNDPGWLATEVANILRADSR
jgi:hypothetical protein